MDGLLLAGLGMEGIAGLATGNRGRRARPAMIEARV
jgi:hypothetical protein